VSKAQDRFFPKASGPVNTHPGPDLPTPQQPEKEKEAEAG
jgi:hypothetical protein